MHIQIVTFGLEGITEEEYRQGCQAEAPAFASVPGLVSKVWLTDPATGTYGGVYTWRSRADYEAYTRSDLFKGVQNHPNLRGVTSRDFGVLEGPTAVTHGLAAAPA